MLSLLTLTQLLSSSFGRSFVICLVKTTLATKRLFERVPFIGAGYLGLGKLVKKSKTPPSVVFAFGFYNESLLTRNSNS
jgi:hypothetical protein